MGTEAIFIKAIADSNILPASYEVGIKLPGPVICINKKIIILMHISIH